MLSLENYKWTINLDFRHPYALLWWSFLGWLEPLLDRIAENKSIVVCPVIDVIEDSSFKFQYGSAKSTSVGGFDWNLQFNWHAIPEHERERRHYKDYAPVRYMVTCHVVCR